MSSSKVKDVKDEQQTPEASATLTSTTPSARKTTFASLDPDIQYKIWALAFPTRRFVPIRVESIDRLDNGSGTPQLSVTFGTSNQLALVQPGQANGDEYRERAFAATVYSADRKPLGPPGNILFCYPTDVAFFSTDKGPKKSFALEFISNDDLQNIQQVAIELNGPFLGRFRHHVVKFSKMKRIFFLHNYFIKDRKAVDLKDFKLVHASTDIFKGGWDFANHLPGLEAILQSISALQVDPANHVNLQEGSCGMTFRKDLEVVILSNEHRLPAAIRRPAQLPILLEY